MSLLCGGGGEEGNAEELNAEEKKRNELLKKRQQEEEAKQQKITKMLLLGAGESGKSTIFKQMKVINKNGYTEKERKEFTGIVYSNTIVSMKAMMGAYEKLEMDMPADLSGLNDQFETDSEGEKLTVELGALIKKMWEHPSTADMFTRRNEFQLNDSAKYYFDDIERISADGYIPTEQDVLRSRVRTTGIVQSDFTIKSMNFSMFDVGGQRNERRKWIHCFDNVNAVVFVAALSEFDQKLYEDETQNRLDEAISLFDQICNSKWFKETAMILFLNKKDLFEEKLQDRKFEDYVSAHKGLPNELKECSETVKKMFLAKNKADKSVFCHVTCATDTKNVSFVFNAVVTIILEENMKASGLA